MSHEKQKKVNVPSIELHAEPMFHKDIREATRKRLSTIATELAEGIEFIGSYPKSVTFFGSARFNHKNPYYKKSQQIAHALARRGYAVVSGGGPGIMEAANRGAFEADGKSIGFTIVLPNEQVMNPYVQEHVDFQYFFTRKVCLTFSAEAYIYFPGGFGTMDEFFEILTLVQTHKIPRVPMILVGSDFWLPLKHFLENLMYKTHQTINKDDLDLFTITDDEKEIIRIVEQAPMRKE
jgi:hypothetical protein